MLPVLFLGTAVGVMWAALRQQDPQQQQEQQAAGSADALDAVEPQQPQQHRQPEQQQHSQEPVPLTTTHAAAAEGSSSSSSSRHSSAKIAAAAVGGLLCLAAATSVSILIGRRRRHGHNKQLRGSRRGDGRIPLKDLIRFKERQWFVEELENARDADPNSMIRLAKMYLNGQGCQRNIALAQEWVRKARAMGVPATLDELYATDDPDPHTKLRQLAAIEERRRALRQLNSSATNTKAMHKHLPNPTAAA